MQTGYTEVKVSGNKYIVSFRGNNLTSNDRVMKYALLRASELTLDHDFNYFKVEKKEYIPTSVSTEVSDSKVAADEKNRRSEMAREKGLGILLHIKCYKENPIQFDVIDAKEYIKYNKKY